MIRLSHKHALKAVSNSRCFHSSNSCLVRAESEKKWDESAASMPDFIEKWNRKKFYGVGVGLSAASTALFVTGSEFGGVGLGSLTAVYLFMGFQDIRQGHHAIRRNFPVLGRIRYLLESIRPEIRQYFIESDSEALPFSRSQRSIVYKRAKGADNNMPMGTRSNVYDEGYQWINHSMYPQHVDSVKQRVTVGGEDCLQPYSASILNVSAMSYGALSDNAVLALNGAAKLGNFYHNTGEGGVSRFHLRPGGDIVWNVGTGYFGCRNPDGTFSKERFIATATQPNIKMIEIKLSQGAKPAHGGILPAGKVTELIAEARGVNVGETCVSPPTHGAWQGPGGLVDFVKVLRECSGGKPIGFKLCLGHPKEFAAIVHACIDRKIYPDFITIDGGEGGTGAAPPEFSNNVGMPLNEGIMYVNNLLIGAGIRDKIKIIASGKIVTGFSLVRTLSLGADIGNAARAMMFALGCVQALKCHTNTCPTGITTQDKELMKGLDVDDKSVRVYRYQQKTVESASEIIGAAGYTNASELNPDCIFFRNTTLEAKTASSLYKNIMCQPNALIDGTAPEHATDIWNQGAELYKKVGGALTFKP